MIKNETKLAGVVALVVAFAAVSAQALHFDARTLQTDHTYAKELFGAGSEGVVLQYPKDEAGTAMAPQVLLTPVVPDANRVDDQSGFITFTLHGAVFGESVALADLSASATAGRGGMTKRLVEGGASGDASVKFEVGLDLDDGGTDADIAFDGTTNAANNFELIFTLPALKGANGALTRAADKNPGVRLAVKSEGITSSWPYFDSAKANKMTGSGDEPAMDDDKGYYPLVLQAADEALDFTAADGANPNIDVENRATFTYGIPGLPAYNDFKSAGAAVSVPDTATAPAPLGADGMAYSLGKDGAGFLKVTVSGNIRPTDVVFLNRNGALPGAAPAVDTGEALTVGTDATTGSLMATGTFALPVAGDVLVRTDGKGILRPGPVTTSLSVDFSKATAADPKAMSKTAQLTYLGAGPSNPGAYAIAPKSAADNSNVRVKCEGNSPCQVYFACDSADGMDVFGKVGTKIPARSTMVFRSEMASESDTAMELGAVVEGWTSGRLSCEVISAQSISVQVLTRSGGVLVNNTYVDDGM